MYIRQEGGEHLLARTIEGPDGNPQEVVLARLGTDPELNLFFSSEQGRREEPELWDGINDFHLLQALENFKRRQGHCRPALVALQGKATIHSDCASTESEE
ncbi:MAG: hypothetical protein HY914_08515 [Desulfomonile tiedjei]|nr:hypothetical protein [Desulfomonile tiedjei]